MVANNQRVDKVKREGGAKHSDINFNLFLLQLTPECFAPTDLFVKNIFDTTRIGLLYAIILLIHLIKQQAEKRLTRSWQLSIRNSVKQIQRTNKRHKAKGNYLTEEELEETVVDAYELAIERAALEAFEGRYETEEIAELVDRQQIIALAMDLILERQFERQSEGEGNN